MSQTMAAFATLGTRSLKLPGTARVPVLPTFAVQIIGVKLHGATCHLLAAVLIALAFLAWKCTTATMVAEVRIVTTLRSMRSVPMIQITRALKQRALASMRAVPFLKALSARVTMQLVTPWQGRMAQVAPHGTRCQALHITDIATPMPSSAAAVGAKHRGVT